MVYLNYIIVQIIITYSQESWFISIVNFTMLCTVDNTQEKLRSMKAREMNVAQKGKAIPKGTRWSSDKIDILLN